MLVSFLYADYLLEGIIFLSTGRWLRRPLALGRPCGREIRFAHRLPTSSEDIHQFITVKCKFAHLRESSRLLDLGPCTSERILDRAAVRTYEQRCEVESAVLSLNVGFGSDGFFSTTPNIKAKDVLFHPSSDGNFE